MSPSHEFDREDREDAPFLTPESPHTTSAPGRVHHDDQKYTQQKESNDAAVKRISFRLKVILFTMILAVEVGFSFIEGPVIRILESIACQQYFAVADPSQIGANGQIPEEMCKGAEVQAELAAVKGYHMFFDGLLCMAGLMR